MYQIEETQSTREKMSYSDVDVVTPLQPKQVQLQQYPAHSSWSSNSSLENNPVSPCFSIRQSTRFSSTTNSSVASSPTIRSSLDGFNKMPLAGVKEEKEKESIDPLSLHDQGEFQTFILISLYARLRDFGGSSDNYSLWKKKKEADFS